MSKTLLVAEKPSVGQDLARALPGPFKKHEGYLDVGFRSGWTVAPLDFTRFDELYDLRIVLECAAVGVPDW